MFTMLFERGVAYIDCTSSHKREPVLKIIKCGKESTQEVDSFNRIHKHSFRGLGADTSTFLRVDSISGGGGCCRLFQGLN